MSVLQLTQGWSPAEGSSDQPEKSPLVDTDAKARNRYENQKLPLKIPLCGDASG